MTTNCWTVFLEICLTDLFKYFFITSQQLIGQQVIYNNWNSRKHLFIYLFFLVGANTEVVFCHYPMAVSLWCCSQGTRGGLKWQFTFLCAQLHTDTHTPASSEAALGWSISRSVFILPLCWWCCVCVCESRVEQRSYSDSDNEDGDGNEDGADGLKHMTAIRSPTKTSELSGFCADP